ncbi:hypothetical protein GFS60_06912 (plasmid) [Rhodococcus sp. WAY2]|nr:hypothetical protein GFS60_06912 [Rhodococcus sp. WAY2]
MQLARGSRGNVDDRQVSQFRARRPGAIIRTFDSGHAVQRDASDQLAAFIEDQAASND